LKGAKMENEEIEIDKYKSIFKQIEKEIVESRYKAMQAVNKELIFLYWNIGKIISENSNWGNKFIDNLAIDLKQDYPDIHGFSVRNLKYMKKFYEENNDFEFVQTVSAQIPWSHNMLIMDKVSNKNEKE